MPSTGTVKTSDDKSDDRPPRSFLRRLVSIVQWTVNLTVVLCLVLVFTPAGDWLGDALISVDPLKKPDYDYIVVLGGSYERGVAAANLYREGWAPKVIVSSLRGSVDGLADVVKAYGVPADDILIDGEGTRTATHPETVAQLPGVDKKTDRFIILTSPYHTSRSRACFERGGYEHICMRSPDWRVGGRYTGTGSHWSQRAASLSTKLYEALGWAMYSVLGWV
jgi:uncharacterized SAM-binding protein YcdF (DUF218 family)